MTDQAVACPKCGQSGAERPGLQLERGVTEAVWFGDDAVPTETLRCMSCDHTWLIPAGSVLVRKP